MPASPARQPTSSRQQIAVSMVFFASLQVLSTLVEDQAMNPLREEKLEERLSALNSCESACEQLLRCGR